MANPLAFYIEMPPVTRVYTTACVLITLAIQLDFVSPFQLYFNWDLIVEQYQIWRLVTPFCFFGSFGFSFFFNIVFTYRYCQMLEEGSFRGRRVDFVYMFLLGSTFMIVCAIFFQILFLGHAFTMMMVYVWSRRNPHIRMNFFAALTFDAPYLPWVLLVFSVILGNNALVDFIGIVCGHLYFFLEDVFPYQANGIRILEPPHWLKYLCDESQTEFMPEEERPGGM
ncbi:unnamed protein product, partial [Mesorhabditis belari]|uniref:Derlin n=1 Tax=Mesorhabditis belari TaxID=2138241 RepID=A0AAF3J9S3_9BILA